MISREMIDVYHKDAVVAVGVLADEMESLRDALIVMTQSRDHWKARCEKAEAANAQEAK